MRTELTGISRIIQLGAVFSDGSNFFGPSLPTGADGANVAVWELIRDGRTARIAWSPDHSPDRRPIRASLEADGWKIDRDNYLADDVASFHIRLPVLDGREKECASTGILLTTFVGHFRPVCAVWLDESHTMFSDYFGSDQRATEKWLTGEYVPADPFYPLLTR